MALEKCTECGNEVSTHATACPNCGKSMVFIKTPNSFKNPANGFVESVPKLAQLWTFLFGPLYFGYRGAWTFAAVMVGVDLLCILTLNGPTGFAGLAVCFILNWVFFPLMARKLLRTNYLRKGWIPIGS